MAQVSNGPCGRRVILPSPLAGEGSGVRGFSIGSNACDAIDSSSCVANCAGPCHLGDSFILGECRSCANLSLVARDDYVHRPSGPIYSMVSDCRPGNLFDIWLVLSLHPATKNAAGHLRFAQGCRRKRRARSNIDKGLPTPVGNAIIGFAVAHEHSEGEQPCQQIYHSTTYACECVRWFMNPFREPEPKILKRLFE